MCAHIHPQPAKETERAGHNDVQASVAHHKGGLVVTSEFNLLTVLN